MASLSLNGIIENGNNSVLFSFSDALQRLVSSSEVFQDLATKLELEAAIEADMIGFNYASLSFISFIVGTLKEMVEKLV